MRFANVSGRASLLVGDDVFDLSDASGGAIPAEPMKVITQFWDEAIACSKVGSLSGGIALDPSALGPPVPEPRAIFGVGLNYRKHAEESGMSVPDVPPVFTKFPTSIVGPNHDVVLPLGRPPTVDWEAEVVFVVGGGGKGIREEDALDLLAGFCIAQDISERTLQMAGARQFSMGKSFDTFCPIGPAIVTLDELDDPLDLQIECSINGTLMQDESTRDMVFLIPELVAFLSSVVTLRPGDICLTGTPAGVGSGHDPKIFLSEGDVIETRVSGLGEMRNRCVAEV